MHMETRQYIQYYEWMDGRILYIYSKHGLKTVDHIKDYVAYSEAV